MPGAEAKSKPSKSLEEYNKHVDKLEAARKRLQELRDQLAQTKGAKAQARIKEQIDQLEKAIKGHEKEIRQKWPGGPPTE
jgi:hypothetical protein